MLASSVLGTQLICYSWTTDMTDVMQVCLCPQMADRDPVLSTTIREGQRQDFGHQVADTVR